MNDARSHGRLVLVVGPSGAGKDTLIDAARRRFAGDSRLFFPTRIVSRQPSAAERNEFMAATAMDARAREGAFALYWTAHGHSYAIPGDVEGLLAAGASAVCNVSRAAIPEARRKFRITVIEVTASPAILVERLAARQRASDGDLAQRVARAELFKAEADAIVRNEGPLEAAINEFCAAIERALSREKPLFLKVAG